MGKTNEDETHQMPPRPLSIYFVSIWSLARGILPLFADIGLYQLYLLRPEVINGQVIVHYDVFTAEFWADFFRVWANNFSLPDKLYVIVSIVTALAFVYLAFEIYLGLPEGRIGFLWVSAGVVIWNTRAFVLRLSWGLPIYSLIALCLASWYSRRPRILEYFGADDTYPKWISVPIGKWPRDLALGVALGGMMAVVEIFGLIQWWPLLFK